MTLAGFKASNHPQQTAKRGAADEIDDRGTDPEFIASLEERFGAFTLDVAAAHHNTKAANYYTRDDDGLTQPWGSAAAWCGSPCVMCEGTGFDRRPVTKPTGQGFSKVVGYAEFDSPCPACNGHGREASVSNDSERVWCNPPYSDCGAWVRKAWAEWRVDMAPALIAMLLPANRGEQKWWQEHVEPYRDRPGSPLRVEFLPGRMRFIRPNWTPGPKGDRPPFGCALLIWQEATA